MYLKNCNVMHIWTASQWTAYMKSVDTSYIYLLKSYYKKTNRNTYIKIQFQNSIERLSFLYQITDI